MVRYDFQWKVHILEVKVEKAWAYQKWKKKKNFCTTLGTFGHNLAKRFKEEDCEMFDCLSKSTESERFIHITKIVYNAFTDDRPDIL